MSGGHFDYGCFRISRFAEELKHEIDINGDETDDLDFDGGFCLEKETIAKLVAAHKVIETAGKLAREIEWLYSGDHGEESFNRLIDEIFKENL